MTKAELEAANVDLAAESANLRVLLSALVDAVDGMDNLDEMCGRAYRLDIVRYRIRAPAAEQRRLGKGDKDGEGNHVASIY